MILGQNLFLVCESQTIFCSIPNVLENYDSGKRHKIWAKRHCPHIFLAGTPMQPINDITLNVYVYQHNMYAIRMSFDVVYVNVRYSSQKNSKVGRKSFDNFRSPQANCDKYFLKLHFLNESI